MATQVLIGDRFGKVLAEVTPEISEGAWRLNEIGRAQLVFSKKDPKVTELLLRHGNRVLIQFSSDIGVSVSLMLPTYKTPLSLSDFQ